METIHHSLGLEVLYNPNNQSYIFSIPVPPSIPPHPIAAIHLRAHVKDLFSGEVRLSLLPTAQALEQFRHYQSRFQPSQQRLAASPQEPAAAFAAYLQDRDVPCQGVCYYASSFGRLYDSKTQGAAITLMETPRDGMAKVSNALQQAGAALGLPEATLEGCQAIVTAIGNGLTEQSLSLQKRKLAHMARPLDREMPRDYQQPLSLN